MLDFKMTKELAMALVFFVLVILFGFWYLAALTPLVFIVLFKWFKNDEVKLDITLLDIAFFFLGLGELTTSLFSGYTQTGSNTSFNIYIILILYIAYRSLFKIKKKRMLFLTVLFFLSIIIAVITMVSFGFHFSNLLEENIKEFNNFKNLYNPLGIWNNLWACILLFLLVFTTLFVLYQKHRKFKILGLFILLLLVFGIVVSFSRGVYLSVLCFIASFNLITLVFKQLKAKQLITVNLMALTILFLSASVVSDSVLTTLSFNKTTSQQRSTSGRVDRWTHALQLIEDNPITGWGNGNFILATDKKPYLSEDAVFSSTIDNTYVQILIEKGILGFVTYLCLFAICTIIVYKSLKNKSYTRKQKLELTIVFSGLVAFLVRELTFSSLFVNNMVFFLFFHLIFFLIPYDIKCFEMDFSKKIKTIIIGTLSLFTLFLAYTEVKYAILNNKNNQFVKAFNKNEKEAFSFLNEAIKLSPNDIILNKNKVLLFSKNTIKIDISNKNDKLLKFEYVDFDSLAISKKHLKTILKLNPFDDEACHNLGWVYFAIKENDSAKFYFNKALNLRPYSSTYRISKILCDIRSPNSEVLSDLSKVIRYAPDVTESVFYREFSLKYPQIGQAAEKEAIFGLKNNVKTDPNPILKARLARLLLKDNTDYTESFKLLDEVTNSLPNLSRPWVYKSFLLEKKGDTARAREFYNKGIFFDSSDYLPKLYYADFLKRIGDDKNSIAVYKEVLQAYDYIMSETYRKNRALSSLRTIRNSYVPNGLLYYVKPEITHRAIFNYFISYYKNTNDLKLQEFYEKLYKKYESKMYQGNELLR